MTAFMPAEKLVAIRDAPPTIDGMLEAAFQGAGIYFPFTDAIVANPYGDIANGLELAFYIGQSRVVGGTTTDIVAYAGDGVFVQMWIGVEDKLPRMARAVFQKDPMQLRHQVEFSSWKLNGAAPAGAFASSCSAAAQRIPFAHPDPGPPVGGAPPPAAGRGAQDQVREGSTTMSTISILLAGLLVTALACGPAEAWSHSGRYGSASGGGGSWSASGDRGGSASGGGGSWSGSGYRGGSASGGEGSRSASGAYGGNASHTRGEGTTATNQYGGTATHETGSGQTTATTQYGGSATRTYGQGTTATNQYGDTAYHATGSGQTTVTNPYGGSATHYAGYGTTATTPYGTTGYHASGAYYPPPPAAYYPYHPPTTVNYYGSSCGNCGGWSTAGAAAAGAMVGMAAGAAIASTNTAAATSSAYNAGVAAGTSSTAAATSSAYSAGVAAGTAAGGNCVMGGIYPTLPAGCISPKVQGGAYYLCGNTWFQPSYGANGVSYRVVASP